MLSILVCTLVLLVSLLKISTIKNLMACISPNQTNFRKAEKYIISAKVSAKNKLRLQQQKWQISFTHLPKSFQRAKATIF